MPVVHSLVLWSITHELQVARLCLCPTGRQRIRAATYEYLRCVCERRMAICCSRSLRWASKVLLKSRSRSDSVVAIGKCSHGYSLSHRPVTAATAVAGAHVHQLARTTSNHTRSARHVSSRGSWCFLLCSSCRCFVQQCHGSRNERHRLTSQSSRASCSSRTMKHCAPPSLVISAPCFLMVVMADRTCSLKNDIVSPPPLQS